MFDRCNSEKSQLVCRIKVSHLLAHNDDSNTSLLQLEAPKYFLRHLFASTFVYKTISSTMKYTQRLLSFCFLSYQGPHDEMSSNTFGKKCSTYGPHKKEKETNAKKNMLTMPRALSASSPTSAPETKQKKSCRKCRWRLGVKVKISKTFENLCKHDMQCTASSVLTFPYVFSNSQFQMTLRPRLVAWPTFHVMSKRCCQDTQTKPSI